MCPKERLHTGRIRIGDTLSPLVRFCRRIVALLARCHDPQRLIWQRPLQRDCIVNWAIKPSVPFMFSCQKYRHRLGMDRLHNVVRFCGQEREELMLASLALPLACPQPPYPCEGKERSAFIKREPMGDFRTRISPFAK